MLATVLFALTFASSSFASPLWVAQSNFTKVVQESKEAILLFALADANTAPFEPTSSKLESFGISSAFVDCGPSATKNKRLCSNLGLTRLPAILYFVDKPSKNPYTGKLFRRPLVYNDNMDTRSLEKFAAKVLPNNLKKFSTFEDLTINSVNGQSVAVFVSDKDSLSVMMKSVSFSLGDGLAIGQATASSVLGKHLLGMAKDHTVPALMITNEKADSVVVFDGDLKDRNAILQFLSPITAKSEQADQQHTDVDSEDARTVVVELAPNSTESKDLDLESAYVIAVHGGDAAAEFGSSWQRLAEGVVKSASLSCAAQTVTQTEFVSSICSLKPTPFYLSVPLGDKERKRFLSNMTKYSFSSSREKDAVAFAEESLSDSSVSFISESDVDGFLRQNHAAGVMSIFFVTNRDASVPGYIKNAALFLRNYAHFAMMTHASSQLLQNFGNPNVPTIVALHAESNGKTNPDGTTAFQVTCVCVYAGECKM